VIGRVDTAADVRNLVEAIETSLFIYPPLPGRSEELGVPGMRGRVTPISHPLANLAGDARLSAQDVDRAIAQVRARYGRMAFGWVVGPSSRPADLAARLEAAGLQPEESLAGMAQSDLAHPIRVNPQVRVREVTFVEALAESEMMAKAYGLPLEVARFFNELLAATADRIRSRGYFASFDGGAPLAWSYLVYLLDSPIVLLGGAATLPEHRGRGLYTALVARRLADARADGRTAAVIQADRSTSAPVCRKLGFRELCSLEYFGSPAS